ncbi:PilZ domain-containing protein [Acuticoccus yangtzensis]|uniref:PilZ domain-containing protein n=1 Tax=Acuticoccus yangtzensis TaxID=1443441 RepID=UPI000949A63A|nr:PilZ domain-containing protein [Acuticoccus yangtzensis]
MTEAASQNAGAGTAPGEPVAWAAAAQPDDTTTAATGATRGRDRLRRDAPDGPPSARRDGPLPPRPSRRTRSTGTGTIEGPGPGILGSTTAPPESNRRAQRIEGGGTVIIDEKLFDLVDWSALGISIRSDEQLYKLGDVETLELEIDLGDYAVNLDLEAEVVNRNSQRTGWRFREPTDTQRQVLRSLMHASLTGRNFQAPRGPVGSIKPDDETAELTPIWPTPRRRRVMFSPIGALMSLPFNAAVIALISGAAILTMRSGEESPPAPASLDLVPARVSPAASEAAATRPPPPAGATEALAAAVAVDRIALDIAGPGLLLSWAGVEGERFDEMQAIATVSSDADTAAPRIILSPCACILGRIETEAGARLVPGEPAASLFPADAVGFVEAVFDAAAAPLPGTSVLVDLPYSGETIAGTVQSSAPSRSGDGVLGLPERQRGEPGTVVSRITTTPGIEPRLAGTPVIVRVAAAAP